MMKKNKRCCLICDCVLTEENVLDSDCLEELEIRAVIDGIGSLSEMEQLALYYDVCLECLENGQLP